LFSHPGRPFITQPALEEINSIMSKNLSLTIVYDNNPYKDGLMTSWGFACVIKGTEKTILFDTGGNSAVLLNNMQQLGIDPNEIDIVVLSHFHGDHVGGLNGLLQENDNVTVYLPATFPPGFKEPLKGAGVKTVEVNDPARICKGVYSSGILGNGIKEQALMIATDRGLILITGCAHPGIVHILAAANKILEDKILLVIGGFHLGAMARPELEEIIAGFRKLGVERVGPCHCSGDQARRMFKQEYGQDFLDAGVGRLIEFE
jgi:7,8-dihydropterin-6-yl-methyl-4-(beta-D-ribofuranosyl)aminobenzene 5'-phosphate synthase